MKRFFKTIFIALCLLGFLPPLFTSCSTAKKVFAIDTKSQDTLPIHNPFENDRSIQNQKHENIILRTKKGDRSIEVELPGSTASLTDFVIPMSPSFKEEKSNEANNDSETFTDDRYKDRNPGHTDREITRDFKSDAMDSQAASKQREIESDLGLVPTEENFVDGDKSYLAGIDHIKQLFRKNRFEAGLLEVDDLLRLYPTDPNLYQMRGTLLDRIGKRDLALQSWNQALKLDPTNTSLKQYIDRKQQKRSLASP